jgi:outer membrane receptor protein involved in Fe transport
VIEVFPRRPSREWLALESSGGTRNTPEGSLFAGKDFGRWQVSGSGGGYSTYGFIPTPAANRGRVDAPAASRDENAMATIARTYGGGSVRFNGLYFHESRDNGTALQTNDTNIGEGNAHWEQILGGGVLSGTFFGSGQSYNQSFSSIAVDRNSESLTRLQHVPAQRLGGGLQWSNASSRRQQWTFGGDTQNVRGFSLETGFAAGNPTVNTSAGGEQRSFGFFAQDTIRATSRVIISAGLRLDHWANLDASSISKTLSTGAVTATPFADRDENFVSPHASLLVRLSDSWALTFAGSRAFRAPTLNELYRSFRLGNVLTNANTNLSAEQLFGGEGGIVGELRRVQLRAVGFAYQVEDPVANVTLSSTAALITRQRQNLGETSSRGMELSAGSVLLSHLRWQLGYQYTRAVVDDFPADLTLAGRNIPQVPRHAFTFQTIWENKSWSASAQGRASGNQFDDDQNVFALGRAFTLDAMLSKHFGGVTLFIAGQNLTNDRYLTARTPTPQESSGIGGRAGIRINLPVREGGH